MIVVSHDRGCVPLLYLTTGGAYHCCISQIDSHWYLSQIHVPTESSIVSVVKSDYRYLCIDIYVMCYKYLFSFDFDSRVGIVDLFLSIL